jgi:hypothetical protein
MNNPFYILMYWLMIIGMSLAFIVLVIFGLTVLWRSLGHPVLITVILWALGGTCFALSRIVLLNIKEKLQDAGYLKQDNEW